MICPARFPDMRTLDLLVDEVIPRIRAEYDASYRRARSG